MIEIVTLAALISILVEGTLQELTIVDEHPFEEYVINHQVLREDALKEAKKFHTKPDDNLGCMPCTVSEMNYCTDGGVINDHCCCDENFNKVLPFVEHICYTGPEGCRLRAENCEEYTRIRQCCCHAYLGNIWKELANGSQSKICLHFIKFLLILVSTLWLI